MKYFVKNWPKWATNDGRFNDKSLSYFSDVDNFYKMAHGNKMVYKEQIKNIFDGFLNFLEKIKNRKIRSVKEWIDIPDEIGESCLLYLVAIVSYFQHFKVFLSSNKIYFPFPNNTTKLFTSYIVTEKVLLAGKRKNIFDLYQTVNPNQIILQNKI